MLPGFSTIRRHQGNVRKETDPQKEARPFRIRQSIAQGGLFIRVEIGPHFRHCIGQPQHGLESTVGLVNVVFMKRRIVTWIVGALLSASASLYASGHKEFQLQEGDIVFSSSSLGQGEAIIAATESPYTHCGVVFKKDGELMVLEAVQPVGVVSIKDFIKRGRPEVFTALRLKSTVTPEAYRKAREWAQLQVGRDYDVRFGWGNKKLYCSELVWKIYQKAGVQLCPPRKFRDYNLERPEVKKIIDQRFGGMDRVPMDEKVVAPSDLAASTLLMEVPLKK